MNGKEDAADAPDTRRFTQQRDGPPQGEEAEWGAAWRATDSLLWNPGDPPAAHDSVETLLPSFPVPQLNKAVLFGLLTSESDAEADYCVELFAALLPLAEVPPDAPLIALVKDSFWDLEQTARLHIVRILERLVKSHGERMHELATTVYRCIFPPDTEPAAVEIARALASMIENCEAEIVSSKLLLRATIIYALRVLPYHRVLNKERTMLETELRIAVRILRESFPIIAKIGRDLFLLLRSCSSIPQMAALLDTLRGEPQTLDPNLKDVLLFLRIPTAREYAIQLVPHAMEQRLTFLLSRIEAGKHTRYEKWFESDFLSSSDALPYIELIVRYICGAIHPPNSVLGSSILQRWMFLGWLLSLARSTAVLERAFLALVYDIVFFVPKQTSIMNIEPTVLLLVHSVPKHASVSAHILDALKRGCESLVPRREASLFKCASSALRECVSVGVIPSYDPVLQCSAIAADRRELLEQLALGNIPEIASVAPALTSPSSSSASRGSAPGSDSGPPPAKGADDGSPSSPRSQPRLSSSDVAADNSPTAQVWSEFVQNSRRSGTQLSESGARALLESESARALLEGLEEDGGGSGNDAAAARGAAVKAVLAASGCEGAARDLFARCIRPEISSNEAQKSTWSAVRSGTSTGCTELFRALLDQRLRKRAEAMIVAESEGYNLASTAIFTALWCRSGAADQEALRVVFDPVFGDPIEALRAVTTKSLTETAQLLPAVFFVWPEHCADNTAYLELLCRVGDAFALSAVMGLSRSQAQPLWTSGPDIGEALQLALAWDAFSQRSLCILLRQSSFVRDGSLAAALGPLLYTANRTSSAEYLVLAQDIAGHGAGVSGLFVVPPEPSPAAAETWRVLVRAGAAGSAPRRVADAMARVVEEAVQSEALELCVRAAQEAAREASTADFANFLDNASVLQILQKDGKGSKNGTASSRAVGASAATKKPGAKRSRAGKPSSDTQPRKQRRTG